MSSAWKRGTDRIVAVVRGSDSSEPRRDRIDSGAMPRVDALVSNERRRQCLDDYASVTIEALSPAGPSNVGPCMGDVAVFPKITAPCCDGAVSSVVIDVREMDGTVKFELDRPLNDECDDDWSSTITVGPDVAVVVEAAVMFCGCDGCAARVVLLEAKWVCWLPSCEFWAGS